MTAKQAGQKNGDKMRLKYQRHREPEKKISRRCRINIKGVNKINSSPEKTLRTVKFHQTANSYYPDTDITITNFSTEISGAKFPKNAAISKKMVMPA
ncbi:hypothetical protein Metlim_0557 [Methanoplanus limicola DSM 2279]|uniref:Uncharacterized protein n=1 Tax=Methanoplanus limicola DSM 2279 TaxID=937775 RepID=H1Z2V2_9EURY|nr:hypothetical protein Metlim_0557 [Methanoplanus limicola DSM 2279]